MRRLSAAVKPEGTTGLFAVGIWPRLNPGLLTPACPDWTPNNHVQARSTKPAHSSLQLFSAPDFLHQGVSSCRMLQEQGLPAQPEKWTVMS